MNILDSKTFKFVMQFKIFMMVFVWGLLPLLLPSSYLHTIGLGTNLSNLQILSIRIFGIIVLLDTFAYLYIYKNPHALLSKKLLTISITDNFGLAIGLSLMYPIFHFPWGILSTIPFQLFFGYWFSRFYKEGNLKQKKTVF